MEIVILYETFYYFLIAKYYYLSISQTIYVVLAFPEQEWNAIF